MSQLQLKYYLGELCYSGFMHVPHASVIYPSEPCVDFQLGDKDGETFCDCELIRYTFEVMVH